MPISNKKYQRMSEVYRGSKCLVCHKELNDEVSLYSFIEHSPLCNTCLQSFSICDLKVKFEDQYVLRILYDYNEYFRKLLFQYKGNYDFLLKDTFLVAYHKELQHKYRDYEVVIIPSSKEDNEVRGFWPNEHIVYSFSNNVFKGLYKTIEYKQTRSKNRKEIRNVLSIKYGDYLRGKKVLIFDDVITSGETLKSAINLIKKYNPKKIDLLVLAAQVKKL